MSEEPKIILNCTPQKRRIKNAWEDNIWEIMKDGNYILHVSVKYPIMKTISGTVLKSKM